MGPDVAGGHQFAGSVTQALLACRLKPDTEEPEPVGGDARGVLHHRALALQVVLVDGTLLLLLQTALVIAALIRAATLPDTRVAHHTWKTREPC